MKPLSPMTSKAHVLHLRRWEECIGIFEKLKMDEVEVTIILSIWGKKFSIAFPMNGTEADIVTKELGICKSGTQIALLRTDEVLFPLLVRAIQT